jgi:hypothetical protein
MNYKFTEVVRKHYAGIFWHDFLVQKEETFTYGRTVMMAATT